MYISIYSSPTRLQGTTRCGPKYLYAEVRSTSAPMAARFTRRWGARYTPSTQSRAWGGAYGEAVVLGDQQPGGDVGVVVELGDDDLVPGLEG
jgi:hypothetical protein